VGPRFGLDEGGGGEKPLPLALGFDPRTVQPVANSLYRLRCPDPQQQNPVVLNYATSNSVFWRRSRHSFDKDYPLRETENCDF
jgi:hypothetical protein